MESSDSFVGRGGSFLPNQSSGQSSTLSKKIQALESSGFSPDEIAEVFKRLGSAAAAGDGSQYRGGSISSWVLNYALPSIVILGTGALIFLLTGGEDEPTVTTENSDEDINCHNESVGDQEYDENMAPSDHRWPASLSRGRIADSDSEQNRLLMTAASSSSSVPLELDPINVNHQRDALYGEASAAWLQELLLTTNTMAADVKIMKEEIQKMNIIAAAASRSKEKKEEKESTGPGSATTAVTILDAANQAEEVASKPPIQLTTADFIFALRLAMKEMAEDQIKLSSDVVKPINRDSIAAPGTTIISKVNVLEDSSIDEEETRKKIAAVTTNKIDNIKGDDEIFKKGCGALMMYVGNVLGNPSLPRYRKISSSNVSFKSLVQNLKGHDKVLKSVGFKMNGSGSSSGFEWIWYSEANQVDSSTIVTVENGSNKEEKKIAPIPTTTSNSQAGKPINDAARTEILTECMRLLEIGKKEGSVILITDLESKLENNLSSTVINTILPSIEEDSKSISNVTLTFAQNVSIVNTPNSPNAVNKIENTSISTSVLDSSIKSSTGDKSLPSVPLGYTPLGFTPKYDGPVEETLDPNSSNLSDTVVDDTPLRFDVPAPIPLAMKFSDIMKIVSSSQDDSAVPNSAVSTGTDCTSTGTETASTAVV